MPSSITLQIGTINPSKQSGAIPYPTAFLSIDRNTNKRKLFLKMDMETYCVVENGNVQKITRDFLYEFDDYEEVDIEFVVKKKG